MIFESELCDLILAGKKTQTRRAARDADHALADGGIIFLVSSGEGGRVRWEVGRTYAVQSGRGKRAVARIRVAAIRYCERADDISEADAIAEGFASAEGFRAFYARINGAGALERACWALTFRMVLHGDYAPFFGLAQEWVNDLATPRARLAAAEAARDILWGRANRRGMAIEASYEALYGVMRGRNDVPRDVKDRLDAIARDLYASMDDPVDAALAGGADAAATEDDDEHGN